MELLTTMQRIEKRGSVETAHRALANCGQVFRHAIATGRATYDPAPSLRGALTPAIEGHFPAVTEPKQVAVILCAEKGAAEAHYALEGLPNKVLAAEYQTVLPDEKLLAEELDKTRRELEARRIARGGDVEGGE
jgi:hypothetical protein